MTQSAASKALDTSVRKLSCILCLCEDVRMASTRNDDRLDAQDPTCRRLLPLWPDLVVSRSRNVHAVDLRQRFQRTDFVEADHADGEASMRSCIALSCAFVALGLCMSFRKSSVMLWDALRSLSR